MFVTAQLIEDFLWRTCVVRHPSCYLMCRPIWWTEYQLCISNQGMYQLNNVTIFVYCVIILCVFCVLCHYLVCILCIALLSCVYFGIVLLSCVYFVYCVIFLCLFCVLCYYLVCILCIELLSFVYFVYCVIILCVFCVLCYYLVCALCYITMCVLLSYILICRIAGYNSVSGRSSDRPPRYRLFFVSLCLKANAQMVPKTPSCYCMLLM